MKYQCISCLKTTNVCEQVFFQLLVWCLKLLCGGSAFALFLTVIRSQISCLLTNNFNEDLFSFGTKYEKKLNSDFTLTKLRLEIFQNEVSETITTKLWLYLAYLVWMPEEVWNEKLPYVYRFFPGTNRIWKPDVIILNKLVRLPFE